MSAHCRNFKTLYYWNDDDGVPLKAATQGLFDLSSRPVAGQPHNKGDFDGDDMLLTPLTSESGKDLLLRTRAVCNAATDSTASAGPSKHARKQQKRDSYRKIKYAKRTRLETELQELRLQIHQLTLQHVDDLSKIRTTEEMEQSYNKRIDHLRVSVEEVKTVFERRLKEMELVKDAANKTLMECQLYNTDLKSKNRELEWKVNKVLDERNACKQQLVRAQMQILSHSPPPSEMPPPCVKKEYVQFPIETQAFEQLSRPQWQYKSGSCTYAYKEHLQVELETACYQWFKQLQRVQFMHDIPAPIVYIPGQPYSYEINVGLMQHRNMLTGEELNVTRATESYVFPTKGQDEPITTTPRMEVPNKVHVDINNTVNALPYLMTPQSNHKFIPYKYDVGRYTICQVDPNAFQEISALFFHSYDDRDTMRGRSEIVRIEAVEHPGNWQIFQQQRQRMQYRKSHLYFHGTASTDPLTLIADGPDTRLATRSDMYLGRAFYVTPSVSYIHDYKYRHLRPNSSSSSYAEYQILAVQCLLGRCVNEQNRNRACEFTRPPLDPITNTRYDSVYQWQDSDTPVFAIYHNHQLYISYLITYRMLNQDE